MGWGHKIDVMRPFILQTQHFGGQLRRGQMPALILFELLADLVILAKDAAQIATGEKDCPRPFGAGDGWLFTKMEPGMGNPDIGINPAEPDLTGKPVHPASTGAAFTFPEL